VKHVTDLPNQASIRGREGHSDLNADCDLLIAGQDNPIPTIGWKGLRPDNRVDPSGML
jgi:hypothetical protein